MKKKQKTKKRKEKMPEQKRKSFNWFCDYISFNILRKSMLQFAQSAVSRTEKTLNISSAEG